MKDEGTKRVAWPYLCLSLVFFASAILSGAIFVRALGTVFETTPAMGILVNPDGTPMRTQGVPAMACSFAVGCLSAFLFLAFLIHGARRRN